MNEVSYKSPLYIQLREVIRGKIEDGEYPPGTAIPSEKQLSETYGIHRLSVRSALNALINEGLLTSVQGKGVFVCGGKMLRDMEHLGGFRHTMQERGKKGETKILIKALRKAGPYYSKLLEVGEEDKLWYIRRIDLSDGEPLALEEIYIPYDRMPGLGEIDINVFSLYDALAWNGIRLKEATQTLRISKLEPSLAKQIRISPEQAVMEFCYSTKDEEGQMVEYTRCYVRGDKTEFYVHYTNH